MARDGSLHTRHREDDISRRQLNRSLALMKLPSHIMRQSQDAFFNMRLIQDIQWASPFTPTIQSAQFESEEVSNPHLLAMLNQAIQPLEPVKKVTPLDVIAGVFDAFVDFTQRSRNYYTWIATRKETMATSGLTTLCAFMDELLTWAQLCVQRRLKLDSLNQDIILGTAAFLSLHLMFKLKQLVPCFLMGNPHKNLVRQVCYLVNSSYRFADAMNMLGQVRIDDEMALLSAFAVTVPTLMQLEQTAVVPRDIAISFLSSYVPGSMSGLLKSAIKKHEGCQNRFCPGNLKAALGDPNATKGLFFTPLLSNK